MAYRKDKYKDKEKLKKTRTEYNKKYYAKTSNAKNGMKRWTEEEEKLIMDSDLLDSQLSEQLGRSMGAIAIKRSKLRAEMKNKKKRKRKNISNKTFGNLKVIKDDGGEKVLCECALCGRQKMMDRYNIQRTKYIQSGGGCGCKLVTSGSANGKKLTDKNDLTGRIFPGVEVIGKTEKLKGTQRVYTCKCLYCGKIFETVGTNLTRGDTGSCGCQKIKQATERITKDCIDGTKISSLIGKMRSDNTSGVKGVSQNKNGYWVAYIGFKGKRYTLYQGPDKEEAIKRRKAAEKELHGGFLTWYESNRKNTEEEKSDEQSRQ